MIFITRFCIWSISSHAFGRYCLPDILLPSTIHQGSNAVYMHTQHWSIYWNRGVMVWLECYFKCDMLCLLPVYDVIVISMISWMLCAVTAIVIIILNVRWCSWAFYVASERCIIFPRDYSIHLTPHHKWDHFGPGYQALSANQGLWLKLWLTNVLTQASWKTRLKCELAFGFLEFLVPKLWQSNKNLVKKSFWVIFTQI